MLFQRSEIPALSGYALNRHKEGVDLIINKKDNSHLLTRKRLGLLDTEYNHSNNMFGRECIDSAIKQHKI